MTDEEFRRTPDAISGMGPGEMKRLLERMEEDVSSGAAEDLRRRLEMLDLLDAHFADAAETAFCEDERALRRRAREIQERLEAANAALYDAIRREIQRGQRPAIPMQEFGGFAPSEPPHGMGYDELDELLCGVFQFEEPDADASAREAEMVFYQPTPARHIFHLLRLAALDTEDVVVDLGSGLGHVPLLTSICTSARAVGIELDKAYVASARECARQLNLRTVGFVAGDARTADLSGGTVFYLHTPFTGSILRCVLDRLRGEAACRPIRVCTYGPCSSAIAAEPWLEAATQVADDRIALFRSR